MVIRNVTLIFACFACVAASASQAPPAAYPLDSLFKGADHIFIGKLTSARSNGTSVTYDVSIIKNVWGGKQKPCIAAKPSYEVGSHYFFFVKKGTGPCMDGGGALRRGLPIKDFSSVQYVVFQDEKYLYPDFGSSLFRVDSIPLSSTKPITLWSGIPVKLLEEHVISLKEKPNSKNP